MIKVEIPVLPTVSAKVSFTNFEMKDDISSSLFKIPKSFVHDPNRYLSIKIH